MPFNSLTYLYFFSIVATAYYLIPYRYRWIFLLAASCYFYASLSKGYFLLILFLILINYFSAIAIEKADVHRKLILFASILIQVGILCIFKYSGIMAEALRHIWEYQQGWENYLILPLGLSYITLQSVGYIVDVYSKRQQAERNPGILALFFLFFPKITAGPIERPFSLIPQFRENHDFDYTRCTSGLKFIVWGLFKKILIADELALIVDPIFNRPHDYSGISLLLAVAAFTLQIYFDFSGYSDIALGSAQVFGINLTNNFRNPYFASSITDFWQRWHISLSSWLRDYIFFPLRRYFVKNKKNQTLSIIVSSMVPMLVSGFWHGTGITYIVWGSLYGLFITIPPLINNLQKNKPNERSAQWGRIMQPAKIVLTLFLVSFSWIFFRAKTLSDALFIISNIFNAVKFTALDIRSLGQVKDVILQIMWELSPVQFWLLLLFIYTAFQVEYLRERGDFIKDLSHKSSLVRWSIYFAVVTTLIIFGAHGFSETSQFIYFRF